MVRINTRQAAQSAVLGALGAFALLSAAPSAWAEPALPVPPAPIVPAPALDQPALPAPAAAPLAAPSLDQPLPPADVQHLSSPENLPPGATLAPTGPSQGRGMSYLRELWHAVQTQDVSKADAVLLLTQRPMNPDAAPPMGVPVGPQAPLPPAPLPPAPLPAG